ncbi:MAG: hypothetical protein MI741_06055, partial [Rhodospirillales bacterium]|nr:hypothetical protein [Rhodospirillales bacterium]
MERLKKTVVVVIQVMAAAFSLYHLWVAFAGPPAPFVLRGLHVGAALVLTFLTVSPKGEKREFPTLLGVFLALAAVAAAGYPTVMQDYLYERFIYVDPLIPSDWIFGVL